MIVKVILNVQCTYIRYIQVYIRCYLSSRKSVSCGHSPASSNVCPSSNAVSCKGWVRSMWGRREEMC